MQITYFRFNRVYISLFEYIKNKIKNSQWSSIYLLISKNI
jgi:hypothetical protein